MPRALTLFWNLCLLRGGPEQVPYSSAFAWGVFCLWLAVAMPLALSVPGLAGPRALLFVVTTAGVEFVVVALLLSWRGFSARLLQTLAALFGADLLLNLLSLPLVLPFAGEHTPAAVYAAIAQLLLFGWSVAVKGHILRSALELPRGIAYLLALSMALATMATIGLLFPDLVAARGGGD